MDLEVMEKLQMRLEFTEEYCRKKEWDINDLSWPQIMEIRNQEG